ncbi:MAG: hypothetical protein QM752_01865 [Gammaproteobacteria bacterium]
MLPKKKIKTSHVEKKPQQPTPVPEKSTRVNAKRKYPDTQTSEAIGRKPSSTEPHGLDSVQPSPRLWSDSSTDSMLQSVSPSTLSQPDTSVMVSNERKKCPVTPPVSPLSVGTGVGFFSKSIPPNSSMEPGIDELTEGLGEITMEDLYQYEEYNQQ